MDLAFWKLTVIGIISSFIGTLAGGGGLISLPAMMLAGIPIHIGIATNKFSSGVAALTSVFYLFKHKQLSGKSIAAMVLVAFFGGVGGAFVASNLTEQAMNTIAFVLLLLAFMVTLKSNQWVSSARQTDKPSRRRSPIVPFLIAAYDGGFGPGSSTFSILYYMKCHHPYPKAVQLTRVLILGSCAGAFLVFCQTGFVEWHYAMAMAVGSAIGSQIGLIALPKVPLTLAKSLLATILILLIGQVALKMV